MLNSQQASIERSARKGHNAVWVTGRQAGKTYIGHEVARGFGSTAYISCNHMMISHHKRNHRVHNLSYFNANERGMFYGTAISGYQLIVVDDFEHMPDYVLERVMVEVPKHVQMLFLGTKWDNFMTLPPINRLLRTHDDDLNDFLIKLHGLRFDAILE